MVRYVESSPADQVQPKTFERQYTKPGDALDQQERVLVDVEAVARWSSTRRCSRIRSRCRRSSGGATAAPSRSSDNQRGHQALRLIEVNGSTGSPRALIDETSDTFIDYRRAAGALGDGGRTYRLDMNDGAEIVWMSSRDGWAHLYLYDGLTGRVKNQITKGNWVVRSVVRVDEAARQIYFTAGGVNPKQDPYFAHGYRINFDGTGMMPLTDADGYHTVSFSPDNSYYVDTWSRVDLAPVSQLRRGERRTGGAGARARRCDRAHESRLARARVVHGERPRRHDGHLGRDHPADELRSGAALPGDREHLRRSARARSCRRRSAPTTRCRRSPSSGSSSCRSTAWARRIDRRRFTTSRGRT